MSKDKNFEVTIFDKRTLSDIFKEIHSNQRMKNRQINAVLADIKQYIKSEESLTTLMPVIKDCLEIGVKNDEQLIKMTAVIQRVVAKDTQGGTINDYGLTEEEKQQLIKEASQIKQTDEEINLNESIKNYDRRE